MAQFTTEILDHVSPLHEAGECEFCEWSEQNRYLVRWKKNGLEPKIYCRECHVYEDPERYLDEFIAICKPEQTAKSIAYMSRSRLAFSQHGEYWAAESKKLATEKVEETIAAILERTNQGSLEELVKTAISSLIEAIDQELVANSDQIFEGSSLRNLLLARKKAQPKTRTYLDFSIRYIPRRFEKERVESWKEGYPAMALYGYLSDLIVEKHKELYSIMAMNAPDVMRRISQSKTANPPDVSSDALGLPKQVGNSDEHSNKGDPEQEFSQEIKSCAQQPPTFDMSEANVTEFQDLTHVEEKPSIFSKIARLWSRKDVK